MKTKIRPLWLWLKDIVLNCGFPPYVAVLGEHTHRCYFLTTAIDLSVPEKDGVHFVFHLTISKNTPWKFKVDSKGRMRFPLEMLRRLGRTSR